ncbi:MAG: hypothetical protein Q9225_001896 [Loekoesia sp. 1 TL-2023]
MKPDVRRVDSLFHICYRHASRIHTTKPYPLAAPNGSTIVLVGYENGLKILWRGGSPIKGQPRKRPWNDDGTLIQGDTVGDEDETDPDSYDASAGLGRTGVENDSSTEFEPIVQSINLAFGTAVLHMAFPHIPPDPSQHNNDSFPTLLSDNLVVAVACSDSSVRLITLPLAPPPAHVKKKAEAAGKEAVLDDQKGPYQERIVVIPCGNNHQSIPICVSMTLAPSSAGPNSDVEMDGDDIHSRQNRSTRSRSVERDDGWNLLIASCSSDLSGLLLIHRIPLLPDGSDLDLPATDYTVPWSIQHLPSPAISLHFNPSLPADERNCRLLVAEKKGTVRLLGCLPDRTPNQCSCLVSLYPGSQSSANGRRIRKHVLDTQWVLGGKAVLVLLEDGGWGIWDLEGHGPKAQSRAKAPQVPTLGSFFTFAIRGHVNGVLNTFNSDKTDAKPKEGPKAVKLAPTTPSTRRMRQENLFSGPLRDVEGPAHGGISIAASQDPRTTDEAVLLWHNDSIVVIPSLRTHWSNRIKGSGNLFGNGAKGEARVINNVELRGERRTDVALLPASEHSSEHSVLITGETRFIFVTCPPSGQQATTGNLGSSASDQRLLEQGDLGLDGMDRVFSSMHDRTQTNKLPTNGAPPKRKVGFLDL